ncbi:MAG: GH32 C-terminal domain-containing protein, partial [Oscillospiraceae bacterium]|nr:GH32 C-terminal domain-containing protein [Oscillospiraceae bacterium]
NDFLLEADVDLVSGGYDANKESRCAGLIFGLASKNMPGRQWRCVNIDAGRTVNDDGSVRGDGFRAFGPGIVETTTGGELTGIDVNKTLHFKLDMKASGEFTYTFGNTGADMRTITASVDGWTGGYVGIMSFCTEAKFSNIQFEDRTDRSAADSAASKVAVGDAYSSNLGDLTACGGTWEVREDGLYSNAVGQGNSWAFSQTTGANFVFSTDVTFLQDAGAATLLFRSTSSENWDNCYAVNLDGASHAGKMWRQEEGVDLQLIDAKEMPEADTYTLTVVAIDSWMQFYVNGSLVGATADYTLSPGNKGQNTHYKEGYFGLLNWNGEMVFQNTKYTEITDSFTPLVKDITITSSVGSVEAKAQFRDKEPITIQYVGNDAATVDVNVTPVNSGAKVTVQGPDGKTYAGGKNIPVSVGKNYITTTVTVTNPDGTAAYATYRTNVHRRQADEVYYNEPYRGQYHYSVKDGWANDPNGMVYYNGVWHLFYQFDDDPQHGNQVHWAHATSTDLITWEEQPMAFYPDAHGAMYSGCAVADTANTSGLFSGSKGGLVAIITCDGSGERIKVAYSEDDGKTWTKLDEIAVDCTEDPLKVNDFRDPKVFRWENKWFMVIAGGPLRIYSSDNLLDWTCESTYSTLHTECPDLYPVTASDGTVKWVLSRGGRLYKVGDFKQVNGKWTFVPDEAYADVDSNGIMNFGQDSYAAMTFYTQDFGTAARPNIPEIIEINWMNTWNDGYCTRVASTISEQTGVKQEFNGTFNLLLKLGLEMQDGKYVLTQTPIEQYETLRDTANAVTLTGEKTGTTPLGFSGGCYEIDAVFTPGADTEKVGFELRKGSNETTKIVYDLKTETISIDRSKSGILVSDIFKTPDSQKVKRNADGTIDMRIYVDRASVEVFANGFTAAGAEQIFPKADSQDISLIVEGGAAQADITVYPMNSIWKNNTSDAAQSEPDDPDSSQNVSGDEVVTRGMLAQILYEQESASGAAAAKFPDVTAGSSNAAAIAWAFEQKLMTGYMDGSFRPDRPVTRQQLAAVLYRYAEQKGYDMSASGDLTSFSDMSSVSAWAFDFVNWAVGENLLKAENGQISPAGTVTAGELDEILGAARTAITNAAT